MGLSDVTQQITRVRNAVMRAYLADEHNPKFEKIEFWLSCRIEELSLSDLVEMAHLVGLDMKVDVRDKKPTEESDYAGN